MRQALRWYPDVPHDIRAALQPLLERWAWLLPTWVHGVVVYYDANDSGSMHCSPAQEYREFKLTVCAGWLVAEQEVREELVRHELLHTVVQPLPDMVTDLIDSFVPEAQRAYFYEQRRMAMEGVVCDLEYLLRGVPAPDCNSGAIEM